MIAAKEDVLKALQTVEDPDLKRDLVSLGMIENIETGENRVSFTVMLTTPACPLKNKIREDCVAAIREHISPDIDVEVEMSARVRKSTGSREDKAILPGVKNIIAVASGKGGVGKSTVAVNLAVALAQSGAKTGLLDGDIYGPSIPTMLGALHDKPGFEGDENAGEILPLVKYGIRFLSIGFFVEPDKALIWRGPMASNALKQLITDTRWGELDYLVLDLPPGTGDIHLTILQTLPVAGVVIVTTPQEVAVADARKAVQMLQQDGIRAPILGIVENMAWFTPLELPDARYHLFGKEGGKRLAEQHKLPLLAQIPLYMDLTGSCDEGIPAASIRDSVEAAIFAKLAGEVSRQLSLHHAMADILSADAGNGSCNCNHDHHNH